MQFSYNLLTQGAIVLLTLAVTGCQNSSLPSNANAQAENAQSSWFSENHRDISLENMNRRKWDNPVIADLDQDGYDDLLLTDHGYTVKLYWNNAGIYSKGYDLIVGDMHGIGVADFNNDGDMDILISRGGGSGSNARNAKMFHISKNRQITEGKEFNPPLTNIRGRTSKFFDGDNDGDLDLILMGFPLKDGDPLGENYLYENDGKGNLSLSGRLPKTNRDGQKVLITDFNNDFIQDLVIYGDGRVMALAGQGKLQFNDVTDAIFAEDLVDVTAIAEIDYDNDGDFDLYLSRGKELKAGDTYYDAATSTFAFYTKRGDFKFDDLLIGDVFKMENYQASYPHQDIFIGEGGYLYEYPGEHHGGQDIKLVSSLALGWPDKLEKKGLYIGYIGNDTWRIAGNTNPPTTGVIHNVKAYKSSDLMTGPQDLLLENQQGRYVDVTAKAKLEFNTNNTGVAVGDYDNNGFQDLFVVKRGDMSTANTQLLFLNNGVGEFELVKDHGIISAELGAQGAAADTFDYDLDGNLDLIYANERGKWHLFKNKGKASLKTSALPNHFVKFKIAYSPDKQASALGATVSVTACKQTQVQRVGASAAPYTQSFSKMLHFGLGNCAEVERVSVHWTNGATLSQTTNSTDAINVIGN